MNSLIKILARSRLFKSDFDYHLVRASMVLDLRALRLPEVV